MHLNEKIVLIIVLYQCLTICYSQIVKLKKRKPGYPGANDCSLSWATESDAPIIDHETSDLNTDRLQETGSVKIKLNSDFKLSCENVNFMMPEALQTTKEVTVKCKEGNILEYQKRSYRYEEFKCINDDLMKRPRRNNLEKLFEIRRKSADRYYSRQKTKLKFYYDLLSPSSRFLFIFMKKFDIQFESNVVNIRKGQHLTPQFANINPFKEVPTIDDKGLIITDSTAILRYICNAYEIPDELYPADPLRQARVDEFIEWNHSNLRHHVNQYFVLKVLWPMKTDSRPEPTEIEILENKVKESLDLLEKIWLTEKPYLGGQMITIADLVGACEVEQTRMGGFEPFQNRPKLTHWIARIRVEFGPHFEQAHKIVLDINRDYTRFHHGPWIDM